MFTQCVTNGTEARPHLPWAFLLLVQGKSHIAESRLQRIAAFFARVAAEAKGYVGGTQLCEGIDSPWGGRRADMEGAGEVDEQRFDGRARHFGSERRGKVGAHTRFCFRPCLILVYHATKLYYENATRGNPSVQHPTR